MRTRSRYPPATRRLVPLLLATLLWAAGTLPTYAQQGGGEAYRPEPAQQAPGKTADRSLLGSYALLAFDEEARQLGLLAATTGFSAGSGMPHLAWDAGAVVVLGRREPAAGRRALELLRRGTNPRGALESAFAAADDTAGLQMGALTSDCRLASKTDSAAYPWSGSRRGRTADGCYLALGSLLPDSTVVMELTASFASAEGDLLDRLMAAHRAAEKATGDVARSHSAALWISAPDAEHGALGRARLRLQVEAVQRPADALAYLIRSGRADHLALRAVEQVEAGAYEEAVALADRAVELEPASARAWMARGRALLYQDSLEAAESAFQRMLEVNPYLLHVLGDPGPADSTVTAVIPTVRRELIPYRPRLIKRLDVYRRSFYPDVEFRSEREPLRRPAEVGEGEEEGGGGEGAGGEEGGGGGDGG